MSDTIEYDLTGNYGLKKPWLDADDDVWGEHINDNMDLIDNLLVTRGFDASKYLPLIGGTMLGELILAADPVNPLDAATKRYVDGRIGTAVGAYLPLIGGEISGDLQVDGKLRVGTVVDAGFRLDVAGTVRVNLPVASIGVSPLIITNGGTYPAAALDSGTLGIVVNSGTTGATWQILSFGYGPAFLGAFAQGTAAAPLAVTNNNALFSLWGNGFDGTNWGSGAVIYLRTAEAWTPAAHGTMLTFAGTPTGAVGMKEWLRLINGDLLVGSTVDAGFKLDVNGNGRFQVNAGATGNTALQITGTPTVTVPLVGSTTLQLIGPSAGNVRQTMDAAAGIPMLTFRRSEGTLAAPAATGALTIGAMQAMGYSTSYSTTVSGAINFVSGGVWSATQTPVLIAFYTTPVASLTVAEAARFAPSGNLLLGTTTDAGFKLDVVGTARVSGLLTANAGATVGGALLTANAGVSLGSTLAPGGVTDLSRGLALFSTTYGLNVTTNRLNFVSPLAIVAVVAGVDKFSVGAAGLTVIGNVGFNGTAPFAKPTVNGAWAGNTAGKALCTALASYGLITDGTSA